jgi:putative methionine-R-sulfoxide reductase with GAF domain
MTEKKSFFQRLTIWLTPPRPVVTEEDKTRVVSMINFLTGMMAFVITLSFLAAMTLGESREAGLRAFLVRIVPVVIIFGVAQVLMRTGRVNAAAYLITIGYGVNTTAEVFLNGGVFSPSLFSFVTSILVAGLFLGTNASIVATIVCIGFAITAGVLQSQLPASVTPPGVPNQVVSAVVSMINTSGLLYLYLRQLNQAVTRLRNANAELARSGQDLEQRVAERTRMLATSVEISRRLSTILDVNALVRSVVDELQQSFNFYHVHIYLFDERRENLVMTGGTGEIGRAMLARGHQIGRGKGLVGRSAETNVPVLVRDTSQDPNWLPNPLLPDTRAELAVPISVGDRVLGVLDVQQNVVGGIRQDDVNLVQSIANQVAIAVQNARAYAQVRAQAEREAVVAAINQKIQRATSIDSVLQIAVNELGKALDAQRTSVELRSSAAPDIAKN